MTWHSPTTALNVNLLLFSFPFYVQYFHDRLYFSHTSVHLIKTVIILTRPIYNKKQVSTITLKLNVYE